MSIWAIILCTKFIKNGPRFLGKFWNNRPFPFYTLPMNRR